MSPGRESSSITLFQKPLKLGTKKPKMDNNTKTEKEINMNVDVDLNRLPTTYLVTLIILILILGTVGIFGGRYYIDFVQQQYAMQNGCELLAVTPAGPFYYGNCKCRKYVEVTVEDK